MTDDLPMPDMTMAEAEYMASIDPSDDDAWAAGLAYLDEQRAAHMPTPLDDMPTPLDDMPPDPLPNMVAMPEHEPIVSSGEPFAMATAVMIGALAVTDPDPLSAAAGLKVPAVAFKFAVEGQWSAPIVLVTSEAELLGVADKVRDMVRLARREAGRT